MVQKLPLDEAIELLKAVDAYLKRSTDEVMSLFDKPSKPMGAKGSISSQTQSSFSHYDTKRSSRSSRAGTRAKHELPSTDLHSCLTVQVEKLHSKDQFPTSLQYARNLANIVFESIKRVVRWAAYHYTNEQSYYPVIPQVTPLNALPRTSHLKHTRKLNSGEQVLMREWAASHGKAVRQRTEREETAMFKAGTLPLKMYATSVPQNDKVRFPQTRPLEASDVEKEHEEVQLELSAVGGSATEDAEKEAEYDRI